MRTALVVAAILALTSIGSAQQAGPQYVISTRILASHPQDIATAQVVAAPTFRVPAGRQATMDLADAGEGLRLAVTPSDLGDGRVALRVVAETRRGATTQTAAFDLITGGNASAPTVALRDAAGAFMTDQRGLALFLEVSTAASSISAIGATGGRPQSGSPATVQVPVISNDPAVQRQIAAQLTNAASARLDPSARVSSLQMSGRPLGEILEAIARASGIAVRLAPGVVGLDAPATVSLSDQAVEDALRAALVGRALTFQPMGSKAAFIYPDSPAERDKYTASIRTFVIARADVTKLVQQLNQSVKPTAEGFRPMILSVSDSRTIVVRAIPELMAWVAAWIAENDKQ